MEFTTIYKINEDSFTMDFEHIVDTYGEDIFYLVFSYVKNHSTAEDLTQDVFITVYEKYGAFKGQSSLKTWISKIAINKCKDYLKSRYFKSTYYTNLITSFMKGEQSSPAESLVQKEAQNNIVEMITSLPTKYREVIFLYYIHDYNVNEISSTLDVSLSTVKTRLQRGRNLLKTCPIRYSTKTKIYNLRICGTRF